jgi:hypothetical protein
MGLSKGKDLTTTFNANGVAQVEIGEWDYVIVQVVGPSGAINFNATNDGGAVTGQTEGNATSATNWYAVQGTNQATAATATSVSANGSFKFGVVGKYLQLTGAGVTVTKLLLYQFKISI